MPAPARRPPLAHLHAAFLAMVPRIQRHGEVYFRHVRCPHRRADCIAEMVAVCWKWYVRATDQGKDVNQFVSALATYAAQAVNSGRRLAGMAKSKDVMNPRNQRRRGFRVEPLPSSPRTSHESLYSSPQGQALLDAFEERLRDNTITPIPDQVQFRLDWPAWLKTLTGRERRLIRAMSCNERTLDLSKEFELSPARISQLRREFHDGWHRFLGDLDLA
jgi:hypothetical protein